MRRKLVVNRPYQMKRALLAGLAGFILASCAAGGIIYHSKKTDARLAAVIIQQERYAEIEKQFYISLIYIARNKSVNLSVSEDKVNADMKENARKIAGTIAEIESIRKAQKRINIASIIFAAAVFLVMFVIILRMTAGVSGQMNLLERYLEQISRGENPVIRPLRSNDSFHSVFEKLTDIVRTR